MEASSSATAAAAAPSNTIIALPSVQTQVKLPPEHPLIHALRNLFLVFTDEQFYSEVDRERWRRHTIYQKKNNNSSSWKPPPAFRNVADNDNNNDNMNKKQAPLPSTSTKNDTPSSIITAAAATTSPRSSSSSIKSRIISKKRAPPPPTTDEAESPASSSNDGKKKKKAAIITSSSQLTLVKKGGRSNRDLIAANGKQEWAVTIKMEQAPVPLYISQTTPRKSVLKQYYYYNNKPVDDTNNNNNKLVVVPDLQRNKKRFEECAGCLVELHNPIGSNNYINTTNNNSDDASSRGTCIICQARTRWFCIGCHHYFCNKASVKREALALLGSTTGKEKDSRSLLPLMMDGLDKLFIDLGGGGGEDGLPAAAAVNHGAETRTTTRFICHNSCFVLKHKALIYKRLELQRNDAAALAAVAPFGGSKETIPPFAAAKSPPSSPVDEKPSSTAAVVVVVAAAPEGNKKWDTTKVERAPVPLYISQTTPKKGVLRQYLKPMDKLAPYQQRNKKRFEECTGCLVELYSPFAAAPYTTTKNRSDDGVGSSRGTCIVCHARTAWFCLGCHHYFCPKISKNREALDCVDMSLPDGVDKLCIDLGKDPSIAATTTTTTSADDDEKGRIICNNPCFFLKHKAQIYKQLERQHPSPAPAAANKKIDGALL